jgi:hypothetical protein
MDGKRVLGVMILNKSLREDLIKKVAFEQRPEREERTSHKESV